MSLKKSLDARREERFKKPVTRKCLEKAREEFDAFEQLTKMRVEIERLDRKMPFPESTWKDLMGIKKIKPKVEIGIEEQSKYYLGYEILPSDPRKTNSTTYKKLGYITKDNRVLDDFLMGKQPEFIGVVHNPLYQNPNAIFIGGTGSAKTVRAKREVENRYLDGRREFIIDPKGEWEHGLQVPQETDREISILEWNGEYPRAFPVRVIPPRFDDRIVLQDTGVLAGVASLRSDNQKAQVAILLNVFNEQVVPHLDHEPRIGDFVEFATHYEEQEKDEDTGDKKRKPAIPHIRQGLAKLKERYDSGLFAPVLEEMLTMPQNEIGVVSAGTVFRSDIYGILIEHWAKLFFKYLMQNTCPKCYEVYTSNDMDNGIRACVECGGHYDSGICQKCGCRTYERKEPDGNCLKCGAQVMRVVPTDIVLEEVQEGTSKSPSLTSELAGIMSINRVMGGGCGIIMITQSATVLNTGGGGQNPIFTNIGMVSFAGSIVGRKDASVLDGGFGIRYGTMNTDEDKLQIIRYSDTKLGTKVCSILPPRSYHPMFSGFDPRRLNV